MFGKKEKPTETPDLELFTIYDSKSKSYDIPAFEINKEVLQRNLINMFNDPQQSKNKLLVNAEDYSIFKIGSYYKTTGEIHSQNLEHVANMHDLRALSNYKGASVAPDKTQIFDL